MAIIDYLKEATKSKNIFNVEEIKKYLYESEGHDSWEEFVDRQRLGDCQSIVSDIKRKYPFVKSVFGEIEIDEPYYDEEGEEQYKMTHHWIEYKNQIYEFSKGTLKDYIIFDNLYDIDPENESRYQGIREE